MKLFAFLVTCLSLQNFAQAQSINHILENESGRSLTPAESQLLNDTIAFSESLAVHKVQLKDDTATPGKVYACIDGSLGAVVSGGTIMKCVDVFTRDLYLLQTIGGFLNPKSFDIVGGIGVGLVALYESSAEGFCFTPKGPKQFKLYKASGAFGLKGGTMFYGRGSCTNILALGWKLGAWIDLGVSQLELKSDKETW